MGLETDVMRTLKTIKRGLELLDDRRGRRSVGADPTVTTTARETSTNTTKPDAEQPIRG